jgi:WD40 repeat protein
VGERDGNIHLIEDVAGTDHLDPFFTLYGHCEEVRWAKIDWGVSDHFGVRTMNMATTAADGESLVWSFDANMRADLKEEEKGKEEISKQMTIIKRDRRDKALAEGQEVYPTMLQGDVRGRTMAYRYPTPRDGICAITGSPQGCLHFWKEKSKAEQEAEDAEESSLADNFHYLKESAKVKDGHDDAISVIQADFELNVAVTGSIDGAMKVWRFDHKTNLVTCQETMKGHKGSVRAIVADIPRRLAVSGGSEETILLWHLGRKYYGYAKHGGLSTDAYEQADRIRRSSRRASAAEDSRRQSLGMMSVASSINNSRNVSKMAPSDTSREVTPNLDGSREPLGELEAPGGAVRELLANFAIGRAAAVTRGGSLCIWDLEHLKRLAYFPGKAGAVYAVQLGSEQVRTNSEGSQRSDRNIMTPIVSQKPSGLPQVDMIASRSGLEGWWRSLY